MIFSPPLILDYGVDVESLSRRRIFCHPIGKTLLHSALGGVVSASSRETRAAALALFGLIGFPVGFLGPRAVGFTIDLAGGREDPTAWVWAFLVMALDSVVSAVAMAWKLPKSRIT